MLMEYKLGNNTISRLVKETNYSRLDNLDIGQTLHFYQ